MMLFKEHKLKKIYVYAIQKFTVMFVVLWCEKVTDHHLFQSATVTQTDEGHSQLLTGLIELALGLLRQSASGLIQD